MEIQKFVKASEVDPLYLDKSYYVAPEQAPTKPYALLFKAMADTGFYEVAKVAMHGREHIVIIRARRRRPGAAHDVLRQRTARGE